MFCIVSHVRSISSRDQYSHPCNVKRFTASVWLPWLQRNPPWESNTSVFLFCLSTFFQYSLLFFFKKKTSFWLSIHPDLHGDFFLPYLSRKLLVVMEPQVYHQQHPKGNLRNASDKQGRVRSLNFLYSYTLQSSVTDLTHRSLEFWILIGPTVLISFPRQKLWEWWQCKSQVYMIYYMTTLIHLNMLKCL